jgi:predicted enzyme related to lactoylglutathione lyase
MSNRLVHFEIPYDDGDRAREFYDKAFGWQIMKVPDMEYTMVMTGPSGDEGPTEAGFINGGLFKREDPFTGPGVVIDVANIEDALKAVTEAGGQVVKERDKVGDMGFAAYFRDSEGNLMGLWETAPSS